MRWSLYNPVELAKCVFDDAARWLRFPKDPVESRFDLGDRPDRYLQTLKQIYDGLVSEGISYVPEKYNPSAGFQEIRSPAALLRQPHEGTCLDLAALFCGICMSYELLPIIVVLEGHALVAVSLTHGLREWDKNRPGRMYFENEQLRNPIPLRECVDAGDFAIVECTGFAVSKRLGSSSNFPESRWRQGNQLTFDESFHAGRAQLEERQFRFGIDIAIARYQWGIASYPRDEETGEVFSKRNWLDEVTQSTLLEAKRIADLQIMELGSVHISEDNIDDYNRLVNDHSLLGGPPQWQHLYLNEFGAFSRPDKEAQILTEIESNLTKLNSRENGLLLHILSGNSGCGKSTLAKQILHRIVTKEQTGDFPILDAQNIRVFELEYLGSISNLEAEVRDALQVVAKDELALIFFDDLFAQKEEIVNAIFTTLRSVSQDVAIYFLVTSPSWIFDSKKERSKKRKFFGLIESCETLIGGMTIADKELLKGQYIAIYGDRTRPELLASIDKADDDIILIKLGLHHGMHYSEYIERLLTRLEEKDPKSLVALLLFSILGRYYVHFPVNLLKSMNEELVGRKLFEESEDYSTINDSGLTIFRIRYGTREANGLTGMPDTIGVFHDRIAQVIYHSWGNKKIVPMFDCNLEMLADLVYRKLDRDLQTRPILAQVFRSQLRISEDKELAPFVAKYGPIRRNSWAFRGDPLTAYRWMEYANSNYRRTQHYREQWRRFLQRFVSQEPETELMLTLICLDVSYFRSLPPRVNFNDLKDLGPEYSTLILGSADLVLSLIPAPMPVLGAFLPGLADWLEGRLSNNAGRQTLAYFVLISLTKSGLLRNGILDESRKIGGSIGYSISRIIKTYILNLEHEYASKELFVSSGLARLSNLIIWKNEDISELIELLIKHISNKEINFKPSLAEILFGLSGIKANVLVERLFSIFISVCKDLPAFGGLTYTAQAFGFYMEKYRRQHPAELEEFLSSILEELSTGKLETLMSTPAYPDFAHSLILLLGRTEKPVTPANVIAMIEPLLQSETRIRHLPYITMEFEKLHLTARHVEDGTNDEGMTNIDKRGIELLFLKRNSISLDEALCEFLSMLEAGEVKLASPLVVFLRAQLRKSTRSRSLSTGLESHAKQLGAWLIQNQDRSEAPYIFSLLDAPPLISALPMQGMDDVAAACIRSIPLDLPPWLFPGNYFRRWLLARSARPDNGEDQNTLLNVTWQYILNNGAFQHENTEDQGHFPVYDEYVLPLLTDYPVHSHTSWWLEALKSALRKYSDLAVDVPQSGRQSRGTSRKQRERMHKEKKGREFLDKVIDALVKQFEINEGILADTATHNLAEVFGEFRRSYWAIPWLARLDASKNVGGTNALITYLENALHQPTEPTNVSDRMDSWLSGIAKSGRDLATELKALLEGLQPAVESKSYPIILRNIVKDVSSSLVLSTGQEPIVLGAWIAECVEKTSGEFANASLLLKSYLEYLQLANSAQHAVVSLEKPYLETVATWFLQNVTKYLYRDATSYGLQVLFNALTKLKVRIDFQLAESAFLAVSRVHIAKVTGGPTSRSYFEWVANQIGPVDPRPYIDLLSKNNQYWQATYFMSNMFTCFQRTSIQLSLAQCQECWTILIQMVRDHLNANGTTIASQSACAYFADTKIEEISDFLQQASEESVSLIEEMLNQPSILFLVTSFSPIWWLSATQSLLGQVLHLWRDLFGRLDSFTDIGPFVRLSRDLEDQLKGGEFMDHLDTFWQVCLQNISNQPGRPVSAKLCSQLARDDMHFRELAEVLPKVVFNQADMEDASFAIGKYGNHGIDKLEDDKRTEFEMALISALRQSLNKHFADRCLIEVINCCQPAKPYVAVTELFLAYLHTGPHPASMANLKMLKAVFHNFRKYEQQSRVSPEQILKTVSDILSTIREFHKKDIAICYLIAVVTYWSLEEFSRDEVVDVVAATLMQVNPKHWSLVKIMCEKIATIFSNSILLVGNLSASDISTILENSGEPGMIQVIQKARASIGELSR